MLARSLLHSCLMRFLLLFSLLSLRDTQGKPVRSVVVRHTRFHLSSTHRYLDYSPSSTNHLGSIHSCTPSPRRPALPVAIPPSPHLYHVPHRHPHCSAFSSFWTHFLRTRSLACYRCRYPILTYFIYPSLFFSVSDPPYSVLPMNIHKRTRLRFSTLTRTYALPCWSPTLKPTDLHCRHSSLTQSAPLLQSPDTKDKTPKSLLFLYRMGSRFLNPEQILLEARSVFPKRALGDKFSKVISVRAVVCPMSDCVHFSFAPYPPSFVIFA